MKLRKELKDFQVSQNRVASLNSMQGLCYSWWQLGRRELSAFSIGLFYHVVVGLQLIFPIVILLVEPFALVYNTILVFFWYYLFLSIFQWILSSYVCFYSLNIFFKRNKYTKNIIMIYQSFQSILASSSTIFF